jgi:WD40 repeat protein
MSLSRIPEHQRRSIFRNILSREYGLRRQDDFSQSVSRFFDTKELLMDPEIVSPHRKAVSCLSMEANTGRFLLAGSGDGTVSIFDISKWGSSSDGKGYPHSRRSRLQASSSAAAASSYHPVARSLMVPAVPNILQLPAGHSSSVTYAQWYPTDAGVFVSGSSDGTILLWDTGRMKPVLRAHPFGQSRDLDYRAATWVAAHLRPTGGMDYNNLMVAGSYSHSELKLVDIRSGASSHQLVGHQGGVTCVQWSPSNAHVVASGSRDGCIRLWDVRKSGSQSCITFLDRDKVQESFRKSSTTIQPGGYTSDYAHLRKDHFRTRYTYRDNKVTKKRRREAVAPNSYDHLESQGANQSHYGRVAALKFLENGQYLASVGGEDGELLLWDLRNGCSLPNKFVGPKFLQAAAQKQKRVALLTSRLGRSSRKEDTTAIWVACRGEILGFSTEGGTPKQVLRGHLSNVTSMDNMEPGRRIVSGSADGMVLCWGQPQAAVAMGRPVAPEEDKDNW